MSWMFWNWGPAHGFLWFLGMAVGVIFLCVREARKEQE